jgi:hypothetical protein
VKENKIAIMLFLVVGMVYFITAKGYITSSDGVFSLRTAYSMAVKGSLEIEDTADARGYMLKTPSGKVYSKYGIGLPILWFPFGIISRMISNAAGLKMISVMDFLVSFYNIFFGAGSVVIIFYLARYFKASCRDSVVMGLCLGLGTISWPFSIIDNSEATQMFFILLAVYSVVKSSSRNLVIGSLALSYLLLLKVYNVIYLPVFAFYVFFRTRNEGRAGLKKALTFMSILAAGIILLLFLNYIRFANFFETGYGKEAYQFSPTYILKHSLHFIFSPDDSMFIYSPLLLAGILGYIWFARLAKAETIFFLSLILLNVFTIAMWSQWGFRFLVPMVPLWLFPLFLFFNKGKIANILLACLVFLSVFIQLINVLEGMQEYRYIRKYAAPALIGEAAGKMPSYLAGAAIIMKHKLLKNDSIYKMSEFGIDSPAVIDNSNIAFFKGLNLWYRYLADRFNKPALNYIPVIFIPLIAVCLKRLFKMTARC